MNYLDGVANRQSKALPYLKNHLASLPPRSLPIRTSLRTKLLNATEICVIGEFKRRSPTAPYLAPHCPLEQQLEYYHYGGVDALSILTEPIDFGGSYHDLSTAGRFCDLPILCKDFIIDPIQIDLAKYYGASVILLIAAMHDHISLLSLASYAKTLGLEVMIELHDNTCLEKITNHPMPIDIISINNRSLEKLTVNAMHGIGILKAIQTHPDLHIHPVVIASGIQHESNVTKWFTKGVKGLLIGTQLMTLGNGDAIREIIVKLKTAAGTYSNTTPQKSLNLKLCGFKYLSDALYAESLGAQWIGLVFANSKRQITLESAKTIKINLRYAKVVAVFKNQTPAYIEAITWSLKPDAIQVYEDFDQPLNLPNNTIIIRAYAGVSQFLEEAHQLIKSKSAKIALLDGTCPGQSTFTLENSKAINRQFKALRAKNIPCWFAGGINLENLDQVFKSLDVDGIDCSSGIEVNGNKNHYLIKALISKFRDLSPSLSADPVSLKVNQAPCEFGKYGGKFVGENLMGALENIARTFNDLISNKDFQDQLNTLRRTFIGRSTPLYYAERLSEHIGHKIYLKREDLCFTGAHKINNALGQGLIAKHMGISEVIAETGAGQHGIATATIAAKLGLKCTIFMGAKDIARQNDNAERIRLLGANLVSVGHGKGQLKDATNEAIRYWMKKPNQVFYIIGSAIGPEPYPQIVQYFQSIIGHEANKQCIQELGRLPDRAIACIGGGSNAIGLFKGLINFPEVALIGVEAGGLGIQSGLGNHAATLNCGRYGVLHGSAMPILQDENGQIYPTHSVSAGLDYPGVGPAHAFLQDLGRVKYETVTDDQAKEAFRTLIALEGIIPALESSHALAYAMTLKDKDGITLVNLSGRGDKDIHHFRR